MAEKIVNLAQIRSIHALKAAEQICGAKKEGDGNQISGYDALIIHNGLLSTLAFGVEKGKNQEQHLAIVDALAKHLHDLYLNRHFPYDVGETAVEALKNISASNNPGLLSIATDECLAYMAYLKRFVKIQSK